MLPNPHGIQTWDQQNGERVFVHIVNSQLWQEITGEEAPSSPVTAKSYVATGLPWFELYDEGAAALPATTNSNRFSRSRPSTRRRARSLSKTTPP